MSKHNRERRRDWKCDKCGSRMQRSLGEQGEEARRQLIASGRRCERLVHMCGYCRSLHYLEDDKLRLLTPAEEFVLRMDVPRQTEMAQSSLPGGTMLFALKE